MQFHQQQQPKKKKRIDGVIYQRSHIYTNFGRTVMTISHIESGKTLFGDGQEYFDT